MANPSSGKVSDLLTDGTVVAMSAKDKMLITTKFCQLWCCEEFAKKSLAGREILFSAKIGKRFFTKVIYDEKTSIQFKSSLFGEINLTKGEDQHWGLVLPEGLPWCGTGCTLDKCKQPNLTTAARMLCLGFSCTACTNENCPSKQGCGPSIQLALQMLTVFEQATAADIRAVLPDLIQKAVVQKAQVPEFLLKP
jgi:hypothetical protein